MTRFAWVAVLSMLLVQLVTGQTPSNAAEDPATAIPAVLHAQAEAWNRGDLKGFMDGYWKSRDLVFATGKEETRGWDVVMERYRARYQSGGSTDMGKLAFDFVEGVHVLSSEFAYIDGQYDLKMTSGKESKGVFTLIFRKFPEGWRIVHDRTCGE